MRSPSFLRSDGSELENPNQKIYKEKPDIETHDWTRALKWDDKQYKVIQFNDEVWENRQCSCKWWHKHLKCKHIPNIHQKFAVSYFK